LPVAIGVILLHQLVAEDIVEEPALMEAHQLLSGEQEGDAVVDEDMGMADAPVA
jgi:hypothetical protein